MPRKKFNFQFPSDTGKIKDSFAKVMVPLAGLPFSKDDLYNLKLVFTEAFANAVEHGNQGNPKLTVDVEVLVADGYIEVAVKDQGPGFDYEHTADCTIQENLLKDGGRGIYLTRQLMDEVKFENNGACIRFRKRWEKG